jgi:hypothetical protein
VLDGLSLRFVEGLEQRVDGGVAPRSGRHGRASIPRARSRSRTGDAAPLAPG